MTLDNVQLEAENAILRKLEDILVNYLYHDCIFS